MITSLCLQGHRGIVNPHSSFRGQSSLLDSQHLLRDEEAWSEGDGMETPRDRGLIPEGLRPRRGSFLLYLDTGKVYGILSFEQPGLNDGDVRCC